jgi:hypothetical protein
LREIARAWWGVEIVNESGHVHVADAVNDHDHDHHHDHVHVHVHDPRTNNTKKARE